MLEARDAPLGVEVRGRRARRARARSATPDQLRQVFWNLVLNAAQASDGGGRIAARVRASRVGAAARTRRAGRDRRRGPAAAGSRPRRWSASSSRSSPPSRRAPASGSRPCTASSRRTAGASRVESAAGEGTTVRVFLPAALTSSARDAIPIGLQEGALARILVVDDETQHAGVPRDPPAARGHDVDAVRRRPARRWSRSRPTTATS